MGRLPRVYPPRPSREAVEEEASLVLEDGATAAVLVHNVSGAGFGAECRQFIRIGSHVSLDRGGRARRAKVRWALRGRFGALFAEEARAD
jgi:hypothetical protein